MEKKTGYMRLIDASRYSCQGIKEVLKSEAAFRQELVVLVIAVILASVLNVGYLDRILMIGSVVLVIVVEFINSAIESIVDRIGLERHELSRKAKDIGSASVMITIFLSLYVWIAILLEHYAV